MEDDSPAARRPGRTDSDLPAEGSRYSGRVLRVAEDLCDRYALSVLRAAADLNSRAFQTRYDEEPERVCSPIPAPYDPQIDVALLQTRLSEEQDRARSYVAERDELAQLVQDHSVAQLQLVRDHAAGCAELVVTYEAGLRPVPPDDAAAVPPPPPGDGGLDLVGRRIRVCFGVAHSQHKEYFPGTVAEFRPPRHLVKFDDGDEKWLPLRDDLQADFRRAQSLPQIIGEWSMMPAEIGGPPADPPSPLASPALDPPGPPPVARPAPRVPTEYPMNRTDPTDRRL